MPSNAKPRMAADGVLEERKGVGGRLNSNGRSAHCCTGLKSKANASLLHNQCLLRAGPRSLGMQTLCRHPITLGTRALTLLFPRGATTLCAAARQCVFPSSPHGQVSHSGESNPLSCSPRHGACPPAARGAAAGAELLAHCTHLQSPQRHLTPAVSEVCWPR